MVVVVAWELGSELAADMGVGTPPAGAGEGPTPILGGLLYIEVGAPLLEL